MNTLNRLMLVNISSNVRAPRVAKIPGTVWRNGIRVYDEQPLAWTLLASADSPNVAIDMDVTLFGLDEEASEESDIECDSSGDEAD